MSENRTNLEIIAPSVEEAIERGLADLGLAEDAVEVEVLDSGSRGLFGLGSRQARVRLTIKGSSGEAAPAPGQQASVEPVAPSPVAPALVDAAPADDIAREETPAPVKEAGVPPADEPEVTPLAETPVAATMSQADEVMLHVARETVIELLEGMNVQADVTARLEPPEDEQSRTSVYIDIRGDDLSILIGPRAETLNALQYITSLIVGKELGRSIPLMVDVQGYRLRRADQIRKLARRMADQAVKTGRIQTLEPMPANERRLVHIELRNYPGVTTESKGEDPRRKVTIIPD